MNSHTLLLYLALAGVSLVWGTSFAAAQIGMRELAPLHLGLLCMGETLSLWVAVGSTLVLGSVYLSNSTNTAVKTASEKSCA